MTENGNRMTRAELIQWLGNAISTETQKPFEEIDYEFVDECSRLLDELMGTSAKMPEEMLAKLMAKLDESEPTPVRKNVGFLRRNLRKIAVAAAVILCMGVTVMAVPALRNVVLDVLQLETGDSVEENGISYINGGKGTSYANMESLISAEKLDILLFDDLHDILKIHKVVHIADTSETIIIFNDASINFEIHHDINIISEEIQNKSEHISTSYATVYLMQLENGNNIDFMAYFNYGNDTYLIKCTSKDIIDSILNSLTENT